MNREQRFLYHGSALALGGNISRPYGESLEVQAASVLPMVGGLGNARVENFNYQDLISFRTAHSTVAGNRSSTNKGPMYNTLATVTIEDLNISDLITADRVVARLVSEKLAEEPEVPMRPVGSYFTNLRIAGMLIECRPNKTLFETETLEEMQERQSEDSPMADGKPLHLPGGMGEGPVVEEDVSSFGDHRFMTSLYRLPKVLPPGCEAGDTPWSIHIRGFGTVYLAEFVVTRYARRLEMLRVKMGSPVKGEVTFGYTEGNGTTYP